MSKNTRSDSGRSIDSASRFNLNQRVQTNVTTSIQNRQNQMQEFLRQNHMLQMLRQNFIQQTARQNQMQQMARQNQMQQTARQNQMQQTARQNQMQQTVRASPVTRSPTQREAFDMELCEALLSADIPLHKISHGKFRTFLEKYTGVNLPTEQTLRDQYVDGVYQKVLQVIRMGIGEHNVWVSIDETCDAQGRFVANVVVGMLMTGGPGRAFLLHSEVTDAGSDPSAVRRMFDRSLQLLWSGEIFYNRVLLVLTDATPRMVKVGDLLRTDYPKMIHVTCTVQGMLRMVEDVRGRFNTVDDLMTDVSKIIRKSPTSLRLFKTVAPGTELPPDPMAARWGGGWLDAAIYYYDHYDAIVRFIDSLDACETVNVQNAKLCLSQPRLRAYLLYIKTNFETLSRAVKRLGNRNVPLADSLRVVGHIEMTCSNLTGPYNAEISGKLVEALDENVGLNALKKISKIIAAEENPIDPGLLARGLTMHDLLYFKYAPIVSVDVERLFPAYKTIFADNGRDFSDNFENIRKHLVIQCNFKD